MRLPAGTIIAVDGPAAAGKGTLARRLAAELGLPYLDTGLLYRAVGRRVLDRGIDPQDARVAEAEARALTPEDLARGDLRGSLADMAASKVAAIPAVRAALLDFQRRFGATQGAVLDGRDIGTVVFPDAQVKLFITASVAERARILPRCKSAQRPSLGRQRADRYPARPFWACQRKAPGPSRASPKGGRAQTKWPQLRPVQDT